MTSVVATSVAKLRNYVDGRWMESSSGELRDVVNPATGQVIASVALADRAEIDAAVNAAATAFVGWRRTPPEDRIQPLFKLKVLL